MDVVATCKAGPSYRSNYELLGEINCWSGVFSYGGGLMSDWGVHLIDMGLWAGDLVEAPQKVITYASNLSKKKMARETFDTMNIIFPKKDYVINYLNKDWQYL